MSLFKIIQHGQRPLCYARWPGVPCYGQYNLGISDFRGDRVTLYTYAKQYTLGGTVDDGDTIYIDGADRLALAEIRRLQSTCSRLILSICPRSALYPALLPPTFSAALAVVIPLPLDLLTQLSQSYLIGIQETRFWDFLQKSIARGAVQNYMRGASALAITNRKATGGAKGTQRSIQAVTATFDPIPMPAGPTATSIDHSFDLALTEDQRRRRDAVPIPYVHEGDGVDLGFDEEDDEEV